MLAGLIITNTKPTATLRPSLVRLIGRSTVDRSRLIVRLALLLLLFFGMFCQGGITVGLALELLSRVCHRLPRGNGTSRAVVRTLEGIHTADPMADGMFH